MRSWFTSRREKAIEVETVSATALGGFGAVEDFQGPRFDPRALNLRHDHTDTSTPSLAQHIADNDDDSSSSVETSDLIPEDDQSAASSALAFDESKYAADDDEESVETSTSDADTLTWKQRRANDFLKDFFSDQTTAREDITGSDFDGPKEDDNVMENTADADVWQQEDPGPCSSVLTTHQFGDETNAVATNSIRLTSLDESVCVHTVPVDQEDEHDNTSQGNVSVQSAQDTVSSGKESVASGQDDESHNSSGSKNDFTRRDAEMDENFDQSYERRGSSASSYDAGEGARDQEDRTPESSHHSDSDYSEEADVDDGRFDALGRSQSSYGELSGKSLEDEQSQLSTRSKTPIEDDDDSRSGESNRSDHLNGVSSDFGGSCDLDRGSKNSIAQKFDHEFGSHENGMALDVSSESRLSLQLSRADSDIESLGSSSRSHSSQDLDFDENVQFIASSTDEHQDEWCTNDSTVSRVEEHNASQRSMEEGDVCRGSPLARRVGDDSIVSIGDKSMQLDELSQSFSPSRVAPETVHTTRSPNHENVVADSRQSLDDSASSESQFDTSEHSGGGRSHPSSNLARSDTGSDDRPNSRSSDQSSIHRPRTTDEPSAICGSSDVDSQGENDSMSSRSGSAQALHPQEATNMEIRRFDRGTQERVDQGSGAAIASVDSGNHAASSSGGTEEHQYEFDLEKLHEGPKRGVRRKISFTQSFSSISSDDSMVFGPSKFRSNAQIRRGGRRNQLPPKNQAQMLGDYESDPSTSAHMHRNSQMMDQARDLDESVAGNLAMTGAESSAALGESFADHHFTTTAGESSVFHSDYDDDESTVSSASRNGNYVRDEVSDASNDDSFSSDSVEVVDKKRSHGSCSGSETPSTHVDGSAFSREYDSDVLSRSDHSHSPDDGDEVSYGFMSSQTPNNLSGSSNDTMASDRSILHNDEGAESHKLHEHIHRKSTSKSLPCIDEASCETGITRDPNSTFRRKLEKPMGIVLDSDLDPSEPQHSNMADRCHPAESDELEKPLSDFSVPTPDSSGYVQTESTVSDSDKDESDSWCGSQNSAEISTTHSASPEFAGFPECATESTERRSNEKVTGSRDSCGNESSMEEKDLTGQQYCGMDGSEVPFDGVIAHFADDKQNDQRIHEDVSFPNEVAAEDYLSASSESDCQSEVGSDSEEENDPRKLVIKEAPLLRLENVTAQTRSSIPETKLRNKASAAGGAWGTWFGFSKKGSPAEPPNGNPLNPTTGVQVKETEVAHRTSTASLEKNSNENELPVENNLKGPTPMVLDVGVHATSAPAIFAAATSPATPSAPDFDRIQREINAGGLDLVQPSVAIEENRCIVHATNERTSKSKEINATNEPSPNLLKSNPSATNDDPPKQHTPVHVAKGTESSENPHSSISAESRLTTSLKDAEDNTTKVNKAEGAVLQPTASPQRRPQLTVESFSPGLDSIETPQSRKSKKKKGKDKKAGLTSHIEKRFRKMNRHGDEVSVGSMNLGSRKAGQQFVVPKLFDDADTTIEKRPWEQVLSARKAKVVCPESPLVVEGLIPEHKLDVIAAIVVLPVPEIEDSETNTPHKEQGRIALDEQARRDGPREDDRSAEGDQNADANYSDDEHDELMSLRDLTELEKNFGNDTEEVNFEEMWDDVSCDGNTAVEFEERKRGKEREKEKKRLVREKAKTARKSKATPRLRLFETPGDENRYLRRKNNALSDEFLLAIQRVFDEETLVDDESGSDAEPSIVDLRQTLQRLGSEKSLYLNGDKSVSRSTAKSLTKEQDSGEKESEEEADDDENDDSANSSAGKRRSRDSTSRKSNSSRGSRKSSRPKKPHVDPAAIFEAELKRQQRAKVMSVSSLKQEMSDRRGTSVRLLQKEFAERRKRHSGLSQTYGASYRSPGSNRIHAMETENVEPSDFGHGVGSDDGNFFGRMQEGVFAEQAQSHGSPWRRSPRKLVGHSPGAAGTPQSKLTRSTGGLTGHLSRWEVGDHVTDLDDLLTVQMSPVKTNFIAGAAEAAVDLATAAASHLPSIPELPNMPSVNFPSVPNVAIPNMQLPNVAMPNMQLPNMSNLSVPNVPGIRHLPSVSLPGAESFGFGATFTDMPLSTIDEKSGTDEENEAGLLDGGWDDEEVSRKNGDVLPARGSGVPSAGRFSLPSLTMKVPKPPAMAVAGMGLDKLKKVKSFIPKIPRRIPGEGGSRQMTMIDDDDDRGLLG